jgi:hypothetical protein
MGRGTLRVSSYTVIHTHLRRSSFSPWNFNFLNFNICYRNTRRRAHDKLAYTSIVSSRRPAPNALQNTENSKQSQTHISTATVSCVFTRTRTPSPSSIIFFFQGLQETVFLLHKEQNKEKSLRYGHF